MKVIYFFLRTHFVGSPWLLVSFSFFVTIRRLSPFFISCEYPWLWSAFLSWNSLGQSPAYLSCTYHGFPSAFLSHNCRKLSRTFLSFMFSFLVTIYRTFTCFAFLQLHIAGFRLPYMVTFTHSIGFQLLFLFPSCNCKLFRFLLLLPSDLKLMKKITVG